MSDSHTTKDRYHARKELRRIARDPDEKNDDDLAQEYFVSLAERFVSALESVAFTYKHKSN